MKKKLHQQAYEKLKSMCAFRRSKKKDKKGNTIKDKIYSFDTFNTYLKHINYFIRYVRKFHPECNELEDARKYVNEWLKVREDENKSAWTVQLEAKALGKLYQISPDDEEYYMPPRRCKDEIKRSRNKEGKYEERFNEQKYAELVHFCRCTGLRKGKCLTKIENDCLYSLEDIDKEIERINKMEDNEYQRKRLIALYDTKLFKEKYFIEVKGKGGRIRFAPILNDDEKVIDKIKGTYKGNKVWPMKQIPNNCDVHGYRRDYAQALYREYASDVSVLPKFYEDQNGNIHLSRYFKRGDDKGVMLDKQALSIVSIALGHGKDRFTTVADNYL